MSDITPADALRELGDDQAEYAAAAAKKLGLPESVEYVEMRTEWRLRFRHEGTGKEIETTFGPDWIDTREHAEVTARSLREFGVSDARPVVREVITTAWREVTQ